jgi:hypothetical protein
LQVFHCLKVLLIAIKTMSGVSTYVAPVYQPVSGSRHERNFTSIPVLNVCSQQPFLVFPCRLSMPQPHPAAAIGAILRAPRNIRHTGNFSYVFSPIREQQLEYVDGILVVSSIFCLAWVLWAFTLLVLKFKGKQVGCASGRAFVTVRSEDAFDNENKNKHVEDTQEDIYSTSKSSGDDLSHRNDPFPPQSSCRRSKYSQRSRQQLGSTADDDHSSEMLSQNSGWISGTFSDNHGDKLREFENEPVMLIINPRESRTRLCFIVYASICLLCMPLIMVFSYGPMKEATDGSDDLILVR